MKWLFRIVLLLAVSTSSAFAEWHVAAGPKFSRIKLYNSASTTGGFVGAGYSSGWLSLDLGYDMLSNKMAEFYGKIYNSDELFGVPDVAFIKSQAVRVSASATSRAWKGISAVATIGLERRDASTWAYWRTYKTHAISPLLAVGVRYSIGSHVNYKVSLSATEFATGSDDLIHLTYPNFQNGFDHYKKSARLYSIEPSMSYSF